MLSSIETITAVHRANEVTLDPSGKYAYAVTCNEPGTAPGAVSTYDLDAASSSRVVPVTLLASTFTRRDALWAVAKALDATTADVVTLTDELLARPSVVNPLFLFVSAILSYPNHSPF